MLLSSKTHCRISAPQNNGYYLHDGSNICLCENEDLNQTSVNTTIYDRETNVKRNGVFFFYFTIEPLFYYNADINL